MAVDRRRLLGGLAATVLPLPSYRAGQPASAGTTVLTAASGKLRLAGGVGTAVWAYNGQVPGPLLRLKLGQELDVRLLNKLEQPTTLCWHGVRTPNGADGVGGLTQQPVPPGGSFDYRFTPPDSGTFWYHPHVWPQSAEQVGRGLYGVLVVDEPEPPRVDEDMLVVLDDWALDAGGQIVPDDFAGGPTCRVERVGSLLTVNSKQLPDRRILAPRSRIRLRLLNACSARIAIVALAGARPTVVAVDGQPSETFQPAQGTVPIGPGARFDLIFDLPDGPTPTASLLLRSEDGPDIPLLQFAVAGKAVAPRTASVKLPENPRLPTRISLERSLKRNLVIGGAPASSGEHRRSSKTAGRGSEETSARAAGAGTPTWCWTLDGRASDGISGRPLFAVGQGDAVTLAFINRTAFAQQMHVHGHVFRVLHDLDDGWDPFWRDSVLVAPGRTKHIAFVADNPGRWAVESLMLARQVGGLAGYFVVDPSRAIKH